MHILKMKFLIQQHYLVVMQQVYFGSKIYEILTRNVNFWLINEIVPDLVDPSLASDSENSSDLDYLHLIFSFISFYKWFLG
jgi:hypothetical protein